MSRFDKYRENDEYSNGDNDWYTAKKKQKMKKQRSRDSFAVYEKPAKRTKRQYEEEYENYKYYG